MYLLDFYIVIWGVSLVCVVPVLIVGAIYILVSNKPANKNEFTLENMLAMIKAAKTKEAFTSALMHFKNKYKVLKEQDKLDAWMNCVKELASASYLDTDAIAKFGQELEDANTANAKAISVAIATVLKTKENK